MTQKNPDLVALQGELVDVIEQLVRLQEASNDPATIIVLATEIRETQFRMTNVQRALFKAQTAGIASAVAAVQAGKADLEKAIAEIDRLNNFIKASAKFLGLVDKVVDVAKLI